MAHPDDAEIRCFGTILKYINAGYEVRLVIACDGQNGISVFDRNKLGIQKIDSKIRMAETRDAFHHVPIEIKLLDNFMDGNIQLNSELITSIEQEIISFEPEILITHFPEDMGVDHQDHAIIGKASINCASRAENIKKILLCEPLLTLRTSFKPNFFVDISDYFAKKIEALSYHKSQSGRFYLEEEFHTIRSAYYSCMIGYNFAKKNKHKIEAFQLLYQFDA